MRIPAEPHPEDLVAVIDSREQHPFDLSPLRTVTHGMVTGDYSLLHLEGVVSVERKGLSDLLACCGTSRERFQREVDRLLAFPARLLVIESDWATLERGEWQSRITPQSVTGSLLGWMGAGLPTLLCGSHGACGEAVARFLFLTARRRWREARALIGGATAAHHP